MAQPHARSASSAPPDSRAPTTAETSWFCCGAGWGPCGSAGGGACGNCRSGSRHCAWPNTSDNCFAITRPDTCGNTLLRRTCGHTFYVKHLCGSTEIAVTIADCGPQTDLWCGERSCCSGNCGEDRLLDLTPSAYSAIGNLSSGIMPVTIRS